MDIAGKVFIVTGGAFGLGEGTAPHAGARRRASRRAPICKTERGGGSVAAESGGGVRARATSAQRPTAQAAVAAAAEPRQARWGWSNCAGIAPAVKTVGKDGAHPLALFSKTVIDQPGGQPST
jgi:NAD(P)-dependent dehydrogenase (short-subunit alcohol dehydrogenase family)